MWVEGGERGGKQREERKGNEGGGREGGRGEVEIRGSMEERYDIEVVSQKYM